MKVQIRQVGNSAGILIPGQAMTDLELNIGDTIEVYIARKGRIKYKLEDLVNLCEGRPDGHTDSR